MKNLRYILPCLFFVFAYGNAQAQIITTFAGTGTAGYTGDGGPATAAKLYGPMGLAFDASGNKYIADNEYGVIRKVNSSGIITTIAGTGTNGYSGDGGPATAAQLNQPQGIAIDSSGNIYIADVTNNRIRKINSSGIITTFAGTGTGGYSGDGGAATAAHLYVPSFVIVDGAGNVYISDFGNMRVRKINTSGIITTIAGNGTLGYSGDGGPATAAELHGPMGVAVDGSGNIYFCDRDNYRIRKVNTSGTISTIAGTGALGFSGDGGAATSAQLNGPSAIALDASGNLFICDIENERIRKISISGIINTIAGDGTAGYSGDGGPATSAELQYPADVVIDGTGAVYIADGYNRRVRMIGGYNHTPQFTGGHSQSFTVCENSGVNLINSLLAVLDSDTWQTETWSVILSPAHGAVTAAATVVSTGATITPTGTYYTPAAGYSGSDSFKVRVTDGMAADTTTIHITINPAGAITGYTSIYTGSTATLTDTTGGGTWSSASSGIATVGSATGVVTGAAAGTATISYTTPAGCVATASVTVSAPVSCGSPIITTFAGTGTGTYSGDGGAATAAAINGVWGIAIDGAGNIYIADRFNNRIRKISTSGIITTIAGTGTAGYSGDGSAATTALINGPVGVAVDGSGNVYFADGNNQRVRKINTSGIITTFAGIGTTGYTGDGGAATAAHLDNPGGVAVDGSGNIYVADFSNSCIRKINTSGIISTIAGTGTYGYAGDGGPATAAQFKNINDVAVDVYGNVYATDWYNNAIRKVNTSGIITTIIGTGTGGYSGDGGPATAAKLLGPGGVGFDSYGNLFFGDADNHRLREINTAGIVTTVAGTGTAGYCCDGGPATAAYLNRPNKVIFDAAGNLYVTDGSEHRVRELLNVNHPPRFTGGHSQSMTVAENSTANAINSLLAVIDSDYGQTETWSAVLAPAHGSVAAAYTTTSTGAVLTPTGLSYTPATGYTGSDSFKVQVTDCVGAADTTVVHVTVSAPVSCGSPNIITFAGTGTGSYSGDGGPATAAAINGVWGVTVDGAGNVYIGDRFNNRVRKISTSGIITTIAGTGSAGFGGDGSPATAAQLNGPIGVAVDGSGNVYFADGTNQRVRKINTSGIISTIAGTGTAGYSGDGAAATAAHLYNPGGIAIDGSGNLYIGDFSNNCIRKVNTSGIISTVAGTGAYGYAGDGGPATAAQFENIDDVALDVYGNMYICDWYNNRIRKVDISSGIITTVAGTGTGGYSGDGGPATAAELLGPGGIGFDSYGNMYFGAADNHRVRKVSTAGIITTVGGTGTAGYSGDGGPATAAELNRPLKIAFDASGNMYITDGSEHRVREILNSGVNHTPHFTGGHSQSMTVAENSTADSINSLLAAIDSDAGQTEIWSTVLAPAHGSVAAAYTTTSTGAALTPTGLSYTPATGYTGNDSFKVQVTDCVGAADTTVVHVTVSGAGSTCGTLIITTVAGNGTAGYTGDGGPATAAELYVPNGLAIDGAGNLYVSDNATRIRKINSSGIITTIAGSGSGSYSGDGGAATAAGIWSAEGIAMDGSGNIYIGENGTSISNSQRVRKINTTSIITTLAGTGPFGGFGGAGDGGPATAAGLYAPDYVTTDAAGNVYISDVGNSRIRKVNPSGIITTIAGSGTFPSCSGFGGDGGPATAALLNNPGKVAVDGSGNVYIPDGVNYRIRKIDPSGIITTIAGAGTFGFSGDGGPATDAHLFAGSIILDGIGNIYFADINRIRKISSSGIITTIAGNGTSGFAGDGGAATAAEISSADGLALDASGNLYFSDYANNRIRKISMINRPPSFSGGHSQSFTMCENTVGDSINSLLAITDSDIGQTETWSAILPPVHGTVSGSYSTVYTGGVLTPIGLSYTPAIGYTGNDSFKIQIIDCGGVADTTSIHVIINVPHAITGTTNVCVGSTTALSDSVSGGTWSPAGGVIASVGSSTGIVTGVATGTATITYTLPTGCMATKIITVNSAPSLIIGAPTVCVGLTTTLTDTIAGGAWSAGSTSIATVGSATGVVTGASPGTAIITYTLATGCTASKTVTVNPTPSGITGLTGVCVGATITLSDGTTGGTWSSGSSGIASVNSSGVVTGIANGTAAISYIHGGCAATAVVTVSPIPSYITGGTSICVGAITVLTDGIAYGTWSSGSSGIATIDPVVGLVTGIMPGTVSMTYTSAAGCSASTVLVVNPPPSAITGSTGICIGLTTTLSDPDIGGAWTSDNTLVATVGSATGIVTGVALGSAGITYTMPSGCFTSTAVTVNSSPGSITGTPQVCVGSTTTLSDPAGGGSWSSSATATATIDGTSGIVSGLIPGTVTITYSLGAGCSVTAVVTVNPLPSGITGTAAVCAGATTTLSDGGGGTWSSGNTTVATTGTVPGAVTGATPGTSIITYTLPTGCTATKTVTVNPLPSAIGGMLTVCSGATTTLSDPTSGGTWSSATTTIANINSTSGAVTAGAAGTAVITYKLSTGCTATTTVTVNPLPLAISGAGPVCAGATITLSDPSTGGTWSTTSTAATVGSASGVVTGASPGTATITYTIGTGCVRTTIVTVNPLPQAITGPSAVCVGVTITETDGSTGGTWISGTTLVATIVSSGAGTGIVTGATLGSTIITYTLSTGCATAKVVSVSLSPVAITGSSKVCVGDTTTLTDAISGGAWSSGNTLAATVGSFTGTVTGVAPGITIITYSLGTGCTITKLITVNASPSAPVATGAGTISVCIGATITLGDVTTGGTWSPATGSIATVNASGIVTGVGAGTAAISYTVAGCSVTTIVTVNPSPTGITPAISGLCAGDSITLSDAISGGTWTSSHSTVATVGTTGTVMGIGAGVTTITYSLGAGCVAIKTITVNPIFAITGSTGICVGATTTLSDLATGGAWSSPGSVGIATVGAATGVVGGVGSGTANITYTTTAGCMATTIVTVNLAPSSITGGLHVCVGATTTLADAAGGGTWTSATTSIATADAATGTITGITPGTSVITYSLGSGCTVNATITVNPSPSAITGAGTVCAGATTNLSDPSGGGTWAPVSGGIATVNTSGVVTGVSAGTATITYTPGTGCFAIKTVTVNPVPGAITGATSVCAGLTTTLNDTTASGMWSSSNTGIAAIAGGIVTAGAAGTAVIAYTLPTGCAATVNVSVNAAPGAIFGAMGICIGATTTLSDPTSGGTWSPASGSVATINAAGVVSGISIGMAAVSYVAGGCPAIAIVTVNALPAPISGAGNVCVGSAIILTGSPTGGTWSSPAGAGTVIIGATGTITGEAEGTAIINYSLGVGCTVSAAVTVNPLPAIPAVAGGADNICKGYTTIVTDAAGSGTWSCSPDSIATITGSGIVTGTGGGTATISYTISTGCSSTTAIFVTAVPPITGATHLCAYGDTVNVYDAMPGGTWSSTLATVSLDGLVTGYGAGTATVTYTLVSGCYAATPITVNPVPGPIIGATNICIGATATLSDTAISGAWSAAGVATVSSTGLVTAVSAGTAVISYVLPVTGCMRTVTVTVDPHPATIIGSAQVCAGATVTLSDTVSGGAWSSGTAGIATVVPATGIVTGISAGTATITYSLAPGCTATKMVTIHPLPAIYTITGGGNYCAGAGGVDVGLSSADAGISYSLYHGASMAGTITGPVTDFGLETVAGTYKVVATNTATSCVTNMPDSVTVTIIPSVIPSVTVAASPASTVCAGTPVTFTATPVNGGMPTYQWAVNSAIVTGVSGAAYSYTPADNDVVKTTLTSNATCAIPAMASDSVTMTVVTPVVPSVTINATPGTTVQPGQSVTLTAVATGGASLTYQWEINSSPVTGATTATFTNTFNSNATVTCIVSAGGLCNPEDSGQVVIAVSNVGVAAPPGLPQGEVTVLPNPNNGEFIIKGSLGVNNDEEVSIEITDMLGQVVYRNKVTTHNGKLDENIQMNKAIANGMYLLNLRSDSGNKVFHIVIER